MSVSDRERLAVVVSAGRLTRNADGAEVLELAVLAARTALTLELVRAELFFRVNLVAVGQ